MTTSNTVSSCTVRDRFSHAMSLMYRREVPQYATMLELVEAVNRSVSQGPAGQAGQWPQVADAARLGIERHGAIRVGTAEELRMIRRLFAVMGMYPVGYYDLSVAGVPVHSTAFRPIEPSALARNPFRIFTSLLRLELIADTELRATASQILQARTIFTPRVRELTERYERVGSLTSAEADEFVAEALETFRWHADSPVTPETYRRLHDAHRLVADVVCFKGPHINHLTPRTLDIDAVQAAMSSRGLAPKELVEGPPRRKVPILLRQTSFKALRETVTFANGDGEVQGAHTARFGEIEQRGIALTRKGRDLYDELLGRVRQIAAGAPPDAYQMHLARVFEAFPDDLAQIRRQGLGFFRYEVVDGADEPRAEHDRKADVEALIATGAVRAIPITYEDFLPVSAAGIFQSNLGGADSRTAPARAARTEFELALGTTVRDEFELYEEQQAASLLAVRRQLAAGQAA